MKKIPVKFENAEGWEISGMDILKKHVGIAASPTLKH